MRHQTDYNSILNDLHYRMDELSPASRRVARYILTNPEKVIRHSLVEAAHQSQSGQASVLRLVRDLGFDGFREFKIQLTTELARIPEPSNKGDSQAQSIISAVSASAVGDLESTSKILSTKSIETVVEHILRSQRIDVFGTGLSGIVGEILSYRLLRLGYNSRAFRDPTLAHELAGGLDSSAVAIAISDSGITSVTVEFLRTAKLVHAYTVAISSRRGSALTKHADALLQTGSAGGADKAGCIIGVVARASCVIESLGQILEAQDTQS